MSGFEWTEDLRVGDAAIDADHQGLFALVRELEAADKTERTLGGIIARLEAYAEGHFAREEALMRRIGYPRLAAHVAEHRAFTEWLDSVKTTYRRAAESPFQIADLVNQFLESWLVNHIRKSDMDYKRFIESQDGED